MSELPVVIADVFIDSRTQYISNEHVKATSPSPEETLIYSGVVDSWGLITRGIPLIPGAPRVSDAIIRVIDNRREWRNLFSHETGRRRIIKVYVIPPGAHKSDYDPAFVGEFEKFTTPPGALEIKLKDRLWSWLDEKIPSFAIESVYGFVPKDVDKFIPIVQGMNRSIVTSPESARGIVPLIHIGMVGGRDRYAVAITAVHAVVVLYRREQVQLNVDVDQPEWVIVDPSEYVVTEMVLAAEDNPFGNFSVTITHVDMLVQQQADTELNADVDGINFRGEYGSLPAVGGSPSELLRNAIDYFINMADLLMRKAGTTIEAFEVDEIVALREQFEAGFGSPPEQFPCDGTLAKSITGWEWLAQYLPSFQLRMFANRRGKITLKFIHDLTGDPDRPVFTAGGLMELNSFQEESPEVVAGQIVLSFNYNPTLERFETVIPVDIDDVRGPIDFPSGDEKIEKYDLDLYYVRDRATAEFMANLLSQFLKLGSYQQRFVVPAPLLLDESVSPPSTKFIEPAQLIGVTHPMGLDAPAGYDNKQVMVLDANLDLNTMRYNVRSVLFPAQSIEIGVLINPDEESFRPVTYDVFDDPAFVNPERSRVLAPFDAFDNDTPFMGQSASYAFDQLASTNSIANYAKEWVYGWPVPNVLRTLEKVTFNITLGWKSGAPADPPFNNPPVIHAVIQNAKVPDDASIPYSVSVEGQFACDLAVISGDQPATQYSLEFTPSQYWDIVSRCVDMNPYNIIIRCNPWGTLLLQTVHSPTDFFSGAYETHWFDTWVTFKYVPL